MSEYPLPEGVAVVEIPGATLGVEYRSLPNRSAYAIGHNGEVWSHWNNRHGKGRWKMLRIEVYLRHSMVRVQMALSADTSTATPKTIT